MAGDDKEKENRGFKIQDKRIRFDEKIDEATEKEKKPESEPTILSADKNSGEKKSEQPQEQKPLPPIDFVQFVMSLASSAMIHLGDMPHPADNQFHPELDAAQETIDILAMLEEKTRGNLSREEASLLTNVLADLRIRFVEKKSKK